ncbi:MAG TPA: BA14K family protein [Xanthobacteraceae bacterium]|nr:BA14K family protein [Xanthobacteraceae bacterium]
MRSKLLSGAAALALTACTVLATASPAAAWGWHRGWHGGGWGWGGAVAAGVIGGAVAAATSPLWAPGYYDYDPGYAYGPGYGYGYAVAPAPVAPGGGAVAYCESRFRSYDPASGTYLGYDGMRHPCP